MSVGYYWKSGNQTPFVRKFRRGDVHIANWEGSPPSLVIIDDHVTPEIVSIITLESFFKKPPSSFSEDEDSWNSSIDVETRNVDLLDPEPVGNVRTMLLNMAQMIKFLLETQEVPKVKGLLLPKDETA